MIAADGITVLIAGAVTFDQAHFAIAEAEAKRARLALADELSARDQQLADLQHVPATNTEKLVAAQKAQAEMLRKERELDDAKRELDLTVEKRVQDSPARATRPGWRQRTRSKAS